MKTISVSEAKATLSEQLRRVKNGEEVTITDRGRAVARLVPVAELDDERLVELEARGLLRRGPGRLGRSFWSLPRPEDPQASMRGSVAEEREAGW